MRWFTTEKAIVRAGFVQYPPIQPGLQPWEEQPCGMSEGYGMGIADGVQFMPG